MNQSFFLVQKTHPPQNDWYNNFLMFSLRKANNSLVKDGFMIININNVRNQPDYCLRMVHDAREFCEYMGCLMQWTGDKNKSAQPLFVFRNTKVTGGNDNMSADLVELKAATAAALEML